MAHRDLQKFRRAQECTIPTPPVLTSTSTASVYSLLKFKLASVQQQAMYTLPRLLLLFSFFAAPFLSLVAAESSREKFNALAKKSPNGIIPLDSKLYEEITASDRDWAVVIQLTAMGKDIKCQPCQCVVCSIGPITVRYVLTRCACTWQALGPPLSGSRKVME
jgi:hypothetical protein